MSSGKQTYRSRPTVLRSALATHRPSGEGCRGCVLSVGIWPCHGTETPHGSPWRSRCFTAAHEIASANRSRRPLPTNRHNPERVLSGEYGTRCGRAPPAAMGCAATPHRGGLSGTRLRHGAARRSRSAPPAPDHAVRQRDRPATTEAVLLPQQSRIERDLEDPDEKEIHHAQGPQGKADRNGPSRRGAELQEDKDKERDPP